MKNISAICPTTTLNQVWRTKWFFKKCRAHPCLRIIRRSPYRSNSGFFFCLVLISSCCCGRVAAQDPDELEDDRTPAQKRYDECMARRERDTVGKAAAQTHKEKVDKFNEYLASLTEHHDIPKVGPG